MRDRSTVRLPGRAGEALVVRRAAVGVAHALELAREHRGGEDEPIQLRYRRALEVLNALAEIAARPPARRYVSSFWFGWEGRPALLLSARRPDKRSPGALCVAALGPRGGRRWSCELPGPEGLTEALVEVLGEMLEPRRSLGGIEELLAVREAGQDDFTMPARPQGGPRGHGRRSSLDPTSPYARPVERRRAAGYEEGLGITRERYEHQGSWFELLSGPAPFDLETGRVFEDHRVFTETGAWIGADRPVPHRRLTNGALAALPGSELKELFERYAAGDYGKGECGFAVYEARNGARLYLVDEATRSLEGEPPLRDPKTTPGPQTLMLASEY